MNKRIILPIFAFAVFFSSCNGKKTISTAEEWVEYTKTHSELKSMYDGFAEITSENVIYIYEELSSIVGNSEALKHYSNEETCYAYWCLYALIPMDMDVNPDKYTAAQSNQFSTIMNRQADLDAQQRTVNVLGDARMIEILKRCAFLSGSQKYQGFFEGK